MSLPKETQETFKTLLESQMVMTVLPLNCDDLTWNGPTGVCTCMCQTSRKGIFVTEQLNKAMEIILKSATVSTVFG
jgi:hypothetical protein